MARIDSLKTLLIEELRDLYDAEQRLAKAIPKLVESASNEELSAALDAHAEETEEHARRLERVFESLETPARAKTCAGIRGIIQEAEEHVGEEFAEEGLRDAAIIGAAQRAEHYEIAAYGTALAYARMLELDIADELQATLDEEKAADQTLTEIAESMVNSEAAEASSPTAEGDGEVRASGTSKSERMARMTTPGTPSQRQERAARARRS